MELIVRNADGHNHGVIPAQAGIHPEMLVLVTASAQFSDVTAAKAGVQLTARAGGKVDPCLRGDDSHADVATAFSRDHLKMDPGLRRGDTMFAVTTGHH